jgi:PmbA protein
MGNDDRGLGADDLREIARTLIAHCAKRGASAAEVAANIDEGLNVNVRFGKVETLEFTRDRGIGVTVYLGQRKGSASSADLKRESLELTVDKALAIARHAEPDPDAGLADAALMAREFEDLDLYHPSALDPEAARAIGARCESAGLDADPRISNSEGAQVSSGASVGVYANSHGFIGAERSTRHSISASLIAGTGENMQRDYRYDTARAIGDLASAESIGRRAAERTVARLDPRPLKTQAARVLFVPELARGLIGHALAALSGGALYRRASFLLDQVGQPIFPAFVHLHEMPRLKRAQGSANFDGEGVATRTQDLVRDGVLQRYVLGSYSARKLKLATTANAGGVHNLIVESGALDFAGMLDALGTGLLVTDLMGQGANTVTGDYSRGAAGFWVERGDIAYPVEEITIAGNLKTIYASIEAIGRDVDTRGNIRCGSILLPELMIAGE